MKCKTEWQILFSVIAVTAATMMTQTAHALTLEDYLQTAKQKNPLLKSYQTSVEASQNKIDAAEIDLVPVLSGSYAQSSDKSKPSQLGTERRVDMTTLSLAKKFSTGTLVKIDAQAGRFVNKGTVVSGFDDYNTGLLGVTVQQSLWKDFFGVGTRTKVERVSRLAELEKMGNDLQVRAALLDIESAYWDYALAQEDLKLKKSNLERAQKIEKWTANRVSNGISDSADLMNARALLALREVQLIQTQEDLKTAESKVRDHLALTSSEATPVLQADLSQARPYITDLAKAKRVVKIEAQMAAVEADAKRLIAEETEDALKPDLSVFGSYATTSYDKDYSDAIQDVSKTDYTKNSVGLNFTWLFETNAKQSQRQASLKESLAAKYKSERKAQEGETSWQETKRKYETLKQSVGVLDKVAQYQRARAKAEQDKLSKGRTVTANVVTAETDAAEAEINLLKTKVSLRKLEATHVLFTASQE